jgi:hypothetical protein
MIKFITGFVVGIILLLFIEMVVVLYLEDRNNPK